MLKIFYLKGDYEMFSFENVNQIFYIFLNIENIQIFKLRKKPCVHQRADCSRISLKRTDHF